MVELAFDVIGDIHGQLEALRRLGDRLGYAVDDDWTHAEGRRLVFVGDLVDRGPHSLEVARLVRRLCLGGQAICLLGNHEFNLIEWRHGRKKPKSSNRPTIEAIEADPEGWDDLLSFFESLPVALELEDLRVIHAVWHRASVEALRTALGAPTAEHSVAPPWRAIVALHAAYEGGDLRPGVSRDVVAGQDGMALELVIKGYEEEVQASFRDNDGALRNRVRTEWWKGRGDVPRDKRAVFGHYWNMPPVPGRHDRFVPPFPSGHPDLRAWFEAHHQAVPEEGTVPVPEDVWSVCIDYNGVTRAGQRACVGAYRYPEAEVVWATVRT